MNRLLLTGAVTVLAAGFATPASAADPKMCSNVPGGDMVYATNTSCKEAHKVVRLWLKGVQSDDRANRTVGKWTCRSKMDAVEGQIMTCRKNKRQKVTWFVNMPT